MTKIETGDEQMDASLRWFRWKNGLSRELTMTAEMRLLNHEGEQVLSEFLETYGLMVERRAPTGEVAAYLAEMPSEPTVFFAEDCAVDAFRFLDLVRSGDVPTFPQERLTEVAEACAARAKAYIALVERIYSGRISVPTP